TARLGPLADARSADRGRPAGGTREYPGCRADERDLLRLDRAHRAAAARAGAGGGGGGAGRAGGAHGGTRGGRLGAIGHALSHAVGGLGWFRAPLPFRWLPLVADRARGWR